MVLDRTNSYAKFLREAVSKEILCNSRNEQLHNNSRLVRGSSIFEVVDNMSAKYTVAASYFHWLVAAPLIGSVGCVLKCQQSPKEEKGKWMWRHKSLGLLTGIIVAPRLGYRLFNAAKYKIGHPSGTGPIEGGLANLSHAGLYAFMTIMPATGIASKYNNELISTSCKIRSLFSNIHLHIAPL